MLPPSRGVRTLPEQVAAASWGHVPRPLLMAHMKDSFRKAIDTQRPRVAVLEPGVRRACQTRRRAVALALVSEAGFCRFGPDSFVESPSVSQSVSQWATDKTHVARAESDARKVISHAISCYFPPP